MCWSKCLKIYEKESCMIFIYIRRTWIVWVQDELRWWVLNHFCYLFCCNENLENCWWKMHEKQAISYTLISMRCRFLFVDEVEKCILKPPMYERAVCEHQPNRTSNKLFSMNVRPCRWPMNTSQTYNEPATYCEPRTILDGSLLADTSAFGRVRADRRKVWLGRCSCMARSCHHM